MNKKALRIAGWALSLSMAVAGIGAAVGAAFSVNGAQPMMVKAADVYEPSTSIDSADVVNGSAYSSYSTDDWIITFGGNGKSVGTNSGNRSKCTLSNNSKYAVSPVTTSSIASAFVSKTSISNISKIKYTFNGGSNQTNTNVYLIYSSNNTTYSQVSLTSGSQGATISNGTEFVFEKLSGYFGLLFVATNNSGNWRIDDVSITLYEKQEPKTISSISLSAGPSLKTDYVAGDAVDVTNIVATATYTDSTQGVVTDACTITANIDNVSLETSAITYSAIYNGEDDVPNIDDLVVNVTVVPVSVSSLTTYGTIKTDYSENETFGLGNGKIQINYNNGTYERVGLDQEGLTVAIGGVDVTGITYYIQTSDAGKAVAISYGGQTYNYNIGTVSTIEESVDGYYQLVTSAEDIAYDDVVIIASSDSDGTASALSITQNSNNRGATDVTISDGKISTISASVQTLTLVDTSEIVSSTFGLYTGSGYLYAASSSNNHLRTKEEADANACFAITFDNGEAALVAQGSNSRNTIRFNSTLFSCYASGQSPVYIYKFVEESKSADQVAVEGFVDAFMHLDDVGINDHGDTNACRDSGTGAKSYYSLAKEAYNDDEILTSAQRTLFRTSEVFKIKRGYERLCAWAEANNESFNEFTYKLEAKLIAQNARTEKTVDENGAPVFAVGAIATALVSFSAFAFLRRKKEDR